MADFGTALGRILAGAFGGAAGGIQESQKQDQDIASTLQKLVFAEKIKSVFDPKETPQQRLTRAKELEKFKQGIASGTNERMLNKLNLLTLKEKQVQLTEFEGIEKGNLERLLFPKQDTGLGSEISDSLGGAAPPGKGSPEDTKQIKQPQVELEGILTEAIKAGANTNEINELIKEKEAAGGFKLHFIERGQLLDKLFPKKPPFKPVQQRLSEFGQNLLTPTAPPPSGRSIISR